MVLKLKTAWRDGTTHLVMSPLEFMQRLTALVPRPRLHLIRFHGVPAPNAKLRALVVPQEPEVSEAYGWTIAVTRWHAGGDHGDLAGKHFRNHVLRTRARALTDSGQATAALKLVEGLEADAESKRALVAELNCRDGEAISSLHSFMSLVELQMRTQYEHSPSLALLRAKAGLCALTAGDRPAAGVLAKLARSAFVAQPGVSPYYNSRQSHSIASRAASLFASVVVTALIVGRQLGIAESDAGQAEATLIAKLAQQPVAQQTAPVLRQRS